jgi:hypothetical protein
MPGRQRTAKCAGSPRQTLTARSPTPACAHLVTAGSNAVGAPPPEAASRRRPRPQQTQPRPPQTTGRHCIVLRPLMHHTGQHAPFHAGHQIRLGSPGSKASCGEGPAATDEVRGYPSSCTRRMRACSRSRRRRGRGDEGLRARLPHRADSAPRVPDPSGGTPNLRAAACHRRQRRGCRERREGRGRGDTGGWGSPAVAFLAGRCRFLSRPPALATARGRAPAGGGGGRGVRPSRLR